MKAVIPPFVQTVGPIWTLANDKWTTPYVLEHRKLAWDQTFKECVERVRDKKGWIIDVGAFIGDSTAWFIGKPILTFEPYRDAFVCLNHNIPDACHLPFPAGNGEVVSLTSGEGGNMGARAVQKGGEIVRTIRIDDLGLENVAFIKIDVEGWEPLVLQGAMETIRKFRPCVRIEFNKPALDRTGYAYQDIEKHFRGWQWSEVSRCGGQQWDALYYP